MPKKTLADTLAARETIYVNCAHPMCCKSTKLDIQALIDRLGRDHGSMHDDLVGLFICSNCKAAGRDRRQVFFTTKASSGRAIATGSQLSNEGAESGRRHLGGVGVDCLVGRRPSGLASAALILPSLGRSE
ncbi:MAG: hypothetical protein EOR04_25565 [Mesorhizobium sp.]|jgi:hypothetical protein|uniref:hypothetical protein n=1 Tax=Mesorhizobium sp. TaxID=1871066 RepID=UPI000FE9CD02|nr:hypothetical protein [Mesorhizobium sp.]RWP38936.1 MAG: hypothetical protein EOR04_25565 [Mesorhizobium sp.]